MTQVLQSVEAQAYRLAFMRYLAVHISMFIERRIADLKYRFDCFDSSQDLRELEEEFEDELDAVILPGGEIYFVVIPR